MRAFLTTLLALAFLAPAAQADCQTPARLSARDSAALRALADDIDARWDARDARGMSELYTLDGDVEVHASARAHTREGIRSHFATVFPQIPAPMRHRTVLRELHVLADGLVLTEGQAFIDRVAADSSRSVARTFTFQTIVAREADRWRIRMTRTRAEEGPRAASAARAAR